MESTLVEQRKVSNMVSSEARTSRSRKPRAALIALCLALAASSVASNHAQAGMPGLLAIRAALEHYRIEGEDGGTLAVLMQLSQALAGNELDAKAKLEARFLRAAAGTDILVLARGRRDAALEQALARALQTEQPLPAVLDGELAGCATGVYRSSAQQMRGTLALLAANDAPTRALVDGAAGSQRDLLFVRAAVNALDGRSDEAALAALAPLGVDPCAATASASVSATASARVCPAPYDRFAPGARAGVAAFADAGAALERLRTGAAAGDPLALAAEADFAALGDRLHARSLLPPVLLPDAPAWTRADGSPLSSTPELLLLVDSRGVRYAFASRVRLDERGQLEAFARQEPSWPQLADVPFGRALHPWVEPLPELLALMQKLQKDGAVPGAVRAEVGTSTQVLADVLYAWKRSGINADLWLSAAGANAGRAQLVQLWSESETDRVAPLSARVRLGGYSLKQGEATSVDIPRVRTDAGWRFDTDTLDKQLTGQRFAAARVSFMSDVSSEDFVAAVLHLAPACEAVAITMP
jgi:hypothetical protein